MSSSVDGVGSFEAAEDGGEMSPDRASTNCLNVNGGFVEGEIAVSSPQPSSVPVRNTCCQALQANMFRAIASTAEMAKRVADYDRIKQENLQMSVQLAELHNYTEELLKKRDELQAQVDRAVVQASAAERHEDEMLKQLTAMEHNSASLRKKAEELEDLQRKYTHLTVVLQDTQEKRAKSARDSKQLCNVVTNLKRDIEKHKEKEDRLKLDKSAAMDRLKAYKKYVPMMIRTIDSLAAGNPDIHTRRRIDILAQPDVRLRLLGSSEVAKEDDEQAKSDDDMADDLESLIRSGVKAPVPVKASPKKKAHQSPVKSVVSPGKDLDDDEEEDELPHCSAQQPQFPTPQRRGTRTTPSTYRRGRGGRAAAVSGRRGVRALVDPEETDKEMMNRVANKLSREAREPSPEPLSSSAAPVVAKAPVVKAPAVVSSIHGKKGLTVREQQASQLKRMTVKERVALMKKKEAEKADVPSHQDIVLPSTSKNYSSTLEEESMIDDLRLSPTPTKEKPYEDTPDRNKEDLLSELRLSPSPTKSVSVSEKSVEPSRPPVTFSLDDTSDLFDSMDYNPGMYSPSYSAEPAVSMVENAHEVNPLAPEEAPQSSQKVSAENEEKEEEKEVVAKETPAVEEKETASLPVDRPHSIVTSASLPHLEIEWPSASTVRALETMEKVASELEPLLTPLKMKPTTTVSSEDAPPKDQPVVPMDTSESPLEVAQKEGEAGEALPVNQPATESVPVVTAPLETSTTVEETSSLSQPAQNVPEIPEPPTKRLSRVTITRGVKPNLPKKSPVTIVDSSDKQKPQKMAKENPVIIPAVEELPAHPIETEAKLVDVEPKKPAVFKDKATKGKSAITPAVEELPSNSIETEKKLADEAPVVKSIVTDAEPSKSEKIPVDGEPIIQKSTTLYDSVSSETEQLTVAGGEPALVEENKESPDDRESAVEENREKPAPIVEENPVVAVADDLYESDTCLVIENTETSDDREPAVEGNAEKPAPVVEENPVVSDDLYESETDLVIDCPEDNVPSEPPVRSEKATASVEIESPVKEEKRAPSKDENQEEGEEEDSMPRTRSRMARVRTISNESETRRTSPRKRVSTRSTPRRSESPSLKIDESDKESIVSGGTEKSARVVEKPKAKNIMAKTPAPKKAAKRQALPSFSEDDEAPIEKTPASATPSTSSFKEPAASRTRVARVRQETRPITGTAKSDGKLSTKTPVAAPSSSRRTATVSTPRTAAADDDLTETPAPSRRIAHRPAQKQDVQKEKDTKPAPVEKKLIIPPPSAVLDYIEKHNIDPDSVNTILITGDDFTDEEEKEEATAGTVTITKASVAKEESHQDKPTAKKTSTLGSLRSAVSRGTPASAQMNKISSALGKRLRQATTAVKCLPPLKGTPKTRQTAVQPSVAKPLESTAPPSKPSKAPEATKASPAVREPKPAPTKAITLEAALPTKMRERAARTAQVKRKAEPLVSAVEPKRICREKRIESIMVSKKSPESLLERALDFDCDPEIVKRKMLEEDLEAIKTLDAKSVAKIMVQVAIRRNTGDQWVTFQAQLRKNFGERIVNKSEDRLIKVPHELCGDDMNIFDPFIRLLFINLASKRKIEPNICYKFVRLIAFAVFAEERISTGQEDIASFAFARDPAKIFRSVLTTIAHEHPECLCKSVVYMINTAPYFKYLSFLLDEDSLPLRRLISIYATGEENEVIHFVWKSRIGEGNIDLPPISYFKQWYMALSPPEGTFSVNGDQMTISEEWISVLKTKELYFTSSHGIPTLLVEADDLDQFLSERVLHEYGLGLEPEYPGHMMPTYPAVLSMDVVKELALRLKSMSAMVSPLLLKDQQTVSCAQVRKIFERTRSCLTKVVRARKHLREKPSSNAAQQTILLSLLTDFIDACAPAFVLRP